MTLGTMSSRRMRGATWGGNDSIIFGTEDSSGLWRLPGAGRTPEALTTLDKAKDELNHEWPELLPDGSAVLFTIRRAGERATAAEIAVRDLGTGEQRVLVSGGSFPRYVSTGHLVYAVDGTIRAVPFDPDRLAVTGTPVRVVDGIVTRAESGAADLAVARDGTLVYLAGDADRAGQRTLVWVDPQGREEPVVSEPGRYGDPALSPDGMRVAVTVRDPENIDVWLRDLERMASTRLTFDEGVDTAPLWSPDGAQLVFGSTRDGGGVFRRATDGTGLAERLVEGRDITPFSWGPEGQLLFEEDTAGDRNIGLLSVNGDRSRQLLLDSEFSERRPAVSPDGRWLAYESDESGQWEIFVRPFPNVQGGRWQISKRGGQEAKWAPDGRALFFRSPGEMMVSTIDAGSTFSSSAPERLFDTAPYLEIGLNARTYDILPDGQRFLMVKTLSPADGEEDPWQLVVVLNWTEELKRLVPTDR